MNANSRLPAINRWGQQLFWLFLALLITAPATMGMSRTDTPAPPFLATWGSSGLNAGQFLSPYDLAVDAQGYVYVVDLVGIVQKFDSRGNFLSKWGSSGAGVGQLNQSQSITIDQNGNLYVADSGNHRIQKFDSDGNSLATFGSQGNGDGQFDFPTGVAVDTSGNIFVVDAGNHRLVKLNSSGAFLLAWGGLSTTGEDGRFNGPRRVAVDGAGHVYATDQGNRRIQKFDSMGNFLTKWGNVGSAEGQFDLPMGIAVDGSGNVYVTEWSINHRIQKFDSNGAFVTQWGNLGSGDGQFSDPYGVAIANNGNVYVADTANSRIQIFGEDPTQHLYLPIVSGETSGDTPTPTPSVTPSPTATPSVTPTSSVTPIPTPSSTPGALICNASGGSGGLAPGAKLETTFNGYPLLIKVSESYRPTVPGFLSIYLHGDEGNHKVGIEPVDGGVYVAPQAPATDGAFHQWYALPEQNTIFLVSLIEDLFSKYNLCRNVIFGGSASGGSVFYDRNFFPTQGGTYPAFWNVNCGGGLSPDAQSKLQTLSQQPAIIARSEFSYTIGTGDFLFAQTSASAEFHQSLGFHVFEHYLGGVGHCAYDVPKTVGSYFRSKLAQMNATVNRPPLANDDAAGAVSGRLNTLDVLANDTDPNADALQVASVGAPSLGSVSIQNNRLAYTPTSAQPGQDVFTYTVSDGKSGLSTASVTVDVQPNAPPLPRNDLFTIPINSAANLLDVLYNDLDPNQAESLTLIAVSSPAHGAVRLSSGALFYTPTVAFTGTETLTYTVSDPDGASAQATVTINVGSASGIVVNTTVDELNNDGDCALREAIQAANTDAAVDGCAAGQGVDTIYLPAGFYQVALITNETAQQPAGESGNLSGDFDILAALTIQGATAGSTTVDGNQIDRVFHVAQPNLAVTMRDLTIQNGLARPQASQWQIEAWGGGVAVYPTQSTNSNAGSLTMERTIVRNNTAETGAGIVTFRGSLLLTNSSVISNSYAGVATLHQMSVINSTFVGNGIEFAGASGLIENSTVDIRNTEDVQGLFAWSGTVTVRNSLFTGDATSLNCSTVGGAGAIVSAGYNVSSNTGCPFTQPSDKKSQAVNLAELAAFGGTPSLAPRFDSPLRNAVPNGVNGCGVGGSVDQRGVSRPQESGCEIGAHEILALPANR